MAIEFAEYVRHGWKLTPFEPGLKGPRHAGWQLPENAVGNPLAASRIEAAGLCHAYSGTCAIDVDDYELARIWFLTRGVELDDLFRASSAVQIRSPKGNRGKLLYELPTPLPTKKVLDGKRTVLEFRCGTAGGLTVQDVLPPSPYPDGGFYQWAGNWTSLPPLPEKLLAAWTDLIQPAAEPGQSVEPTVDRGALMGALERLDPDMHYDEWIKVGQAIHHEYGGSEEGFAEWLRWSAGGTKFKGEADLRTHWKSFSVGGGITGQSLLQMQTASADEFPIVQVQEPSVEYLTPREVLQPRDLPPFLVEGILEQDSECSVIGPTGSYKSLLAFELAACISSGTPFFGRSTQKGLVVMLIGEGRGGIDRRLQALQAVRTLDLTHAALAIYPRPRVLPTAESVNYFRALIAHAEQRFGCKLKLLVIDTYSRYSKGDENEVSDTYTFFNAARACRGQASLMVCHHTGHGDKARARGSSAWGQLVDTEFVAEIHESGIRIFHNTKQKDGEPAAPMYFTLRQAPTRLTRAGEPVTSVVLEPAVLEAHDPLTPTERLVHDALEGSDGLAAEQVARACDMKLNAVVRVLRKLIEAGYVRLNEGVYTVHSPKDDFTDLIGD